MITLFIIAVIISIIGIVKFKKSEDYWFYEAPTISRLLFVLCWIFTSVASVALIANYLP